MVPDFFMEVFWIYLIGGLIMFAYVIKNIPDNIKKYTEESILIEKI